MNNYETMSKEDNDILSCLVSVSESQTKECSPKKNDHQEIKIQ